MAKSDQISSYVLGVGLTKFIKPRGLVDYPELGFESGVKALLDAKITYDDVDLGIACYCYGDSTCGQRVFYQFGMSSIPIYNVNNNCATGSTGLQLARTLIGHGVNDCVLVVGFEKMRPGSLSSNFPDRPSPIGLMRKMTEKMFGLEKCPPNAQYFGNAGREYIKKFGAKAEDIAEIARVNHEHSQRNPYAQFQDVYTLEEILKAPMIYHPLTKTQCCPTSDGSGAAVVVSQRFLDARPHLKEQAILMAGQSLMTDSTQLYSGSAMDLVGFDMTKRAARAAFEEAGVTPQDVQVVEVHDCFASNELLAIDALGLSEPGKAHQLIRQGGITYGGKYVVNPSGGLISKGHPLGATGLAQCAELTWQLRGWATNRLVPNTHVALQHNLGLGGAVVVTIYKRADGKSSPTLTERDVKRVSGVGYNPAVEARGVTTEEANRVRSKENRNDWALDDTQKKVETRL